MGTAMSQYPLHVVTACFFVPIGVVWRTRLTADVEVDAVIGAVYGDICNRFSSFFVNDANPCQGKSGDASRRESGEI